MPTPWLVKTNNFKQSPLLGEVITCEKRKVVLLSLKKLGLYWGLALFSVLIPVLHFILVPTFLVIGLITFFSLYKNSHYLSFGSYVCPLCDNRITLEKTYFYERKKINCDVCMEHLVLEHSKL